MTLQPTYDRPPEGLAQGRWPAPAWVVGVLTAALVLGAVAFVVTRLRRRR